MLLNEIIDTKERDIQIKRHFGGTPPPEGKDPKELGRGYYSRVRSTPDPHIVSKITHNITEPDIAYKIFVKYVIKDKLWENPHFPRIYTAEKFTDEAGKEVMRWKTETLLPYSQVSHKEITQLANRYLKSLTGFNDELKRLSRTNTVQKMYAGALAHVLRSYISHREFDNIKDETLKQALIILTDIMDKHGYWPDINASNIMFRRTPHGLQLVFSDPFTN